MQASISSTINFLSTGTIPSTSEQPKKGTILSRSIHPSRKLLAQTEAQVTILRTRNRIVHTMLGYEKPIGEAANTFEGMCLKIM